jgi:endonuclease YncB( thermonuclease family)
MSNFTKDYEKVGQKLKDTFGVFTPEFPLDNEKKKDLKLDYSYLNALIADLKELDFDAPRWIPSFKYGKVVHVYDGDTFHIIAYVKNADGGIYKFTCRLRDIDTPELNDEKQHDDAVKARDFLINTILNEVVRVEDLDYDKYGRLLCHVFINDKNVSKMLINKGLGYEYHGGKKKVAHT